MPHDDVLYIFDPDPAQCGYYADVFHQHCSLAFLPTRDSVMAELSRTQGHVVIAELAQEGEGGFRESLMQLPLRELKSTLILTMKQVETNLIYSLLSHGVRDVFIKPMRGEELREKILFYFTESQLAPSGNLDDLLLQIRDSLTIKEHRILDTILKSPDLSFDKNELVKVVWPDVQVVGKTFDVHLFNLRRKLSDYNFEILYEGNGRFRLSKRK